MDSLPAFVKSFWAKGEVKIDNFLFWMHYRATSCFLLVFAIILGSKQYFGEPIECFAGQAAKEVPPSLLNLYCWVHTTFILPDALGKKIGRDVISPGIDTYKPDAEKIHLKYYQWVVLFFLLQALLFLAPHYIWRSLEGGKLASIRMSLSSPIHIDREKLDSEIDHIAYYLNTISNSQCRRYAFSFYVCELLNTVNVIVQFCMIDVLLGGRFISYGTQAYTYMKDDSLEDVVDPMRAIFPRVSKCTFYRYGPTGNIQNHDALCILPLNIVNEKVFLFIWFWFVILLVGSGLMHVYRLVFLACREFRWYMFNKSYGPFHENVEKAFRSGGTGFTEQGKTERNAGFWFLLTGLADCTDTLHFSKILQKLVRPYESEDDKASPFLSGSTHC